MQAILASVIAVGLLTGADSQRPVLSADEGGRAPILRYTTPLVKLWKRCWLSVRLREGMTPEEVKPILGAPSPEMAGGMGGFELFYPKYNVLVYFSDRYVLKPGIPIPPPRLVWYIVQR